MTTSRLAWFASACAAGTACGDDARARAHAADVASFDLVWTTVRDRHFDPAISGLDWEAVRTELRPKVRAAKDRTAARAVMREMLDRLQLSHFAIIETGDENSGDGTFGMVGLDVRSIDGAMIVTDVESDGPADDVDVKRGWRIDAIAGKPVAELLAEVRANHRDMPVLPAEEVGVTIGELAGSTRHLVEVTFDDGAGNSVVKKLRRVDATHQIATFGYLVGLVAYDSRLLDDDIGYIHLSGFFDPKKVMARYRADLATMKDARGVVIDLRGNGGGLGTMASGMLGELVRDMAVLGTTRSRAGEQRTVVNPQPHPYDGAIAVLVDELSMSSSEIFAAGIQDLQRGRVFGRQTPGFALPSALERLPNGDTFQYAVAMYVTSNGRTLEGNGVEPDEHIALERGALLSGRDAALEAALAWIDRHHTEEPSP